MQFNSLIHRIKKSVLSESVYRLLFSDSEHAFWLDSSRIDKGYSRFSFMGDNSGPFAHTITYSVGGATVKTTINSISHYDENIFEYLERTLKNYKIRDNNDVPFNFLGGYVGFFGYELMAVTEGVIGNKSSLPDSHLLFSDRFIAIDHDLDEIYIVALYTDSDKAAKDWVKSITSRVLAPYSPSTPKKAPLRLADEVSQYFLQDKIEYLSNIEKCKEKILDGDSYEICLTNRLRVDLSQHAGLDTLDMYLTLRETNPAPYSCYIKCNAYSILSSSPERFLKIDVDGTVEARPIKGTTSRSNNIEVDSQNRLNLLNDKKYFSENLMIVDLLRNDLTKVCVPGTVTVTSLMHVESYATVHQLISTIQGKLRVTSAKCIASCFPGGSMTGAPKRRTLEIINELEKTPRGVYSGAIGYLSLNNTADLNIVIRTIVISNGIAEIGVGGAITQLSDPAEEYDETILKALAPFSVLAKYKTQ